MRTNVERVIRAVCQTPWAIQPERLESITAALAARARGERLIAEEDLLLRRAAKQREREAARSRPQARRPSGVAVIQVFDTIYHRMGGMDAPMSGGASAERLGIEIDRALDDDGIEAVVLDVDSPGGSVYGIDELATKVFEGRKRKRIITVSNALMASGAYYFGSAADEVVVTPSGEIGSIGVFAVHLDFSEFLANEGIKATIIRAGEHKAEGHPYEPLSEEALAYMQQQVNEYYDLFIAAVARNRGVEEETVLSAYGQGRTLTARRAVEVGMADRVATLEEVLADLGIDRRRQIGASASHASEPAIAAEHDRTPDAGPAAQATDPATEVTTEPTAEATPEPGADDGGAPASATQSPASLTAPGAKEDAMGPTTDTAAQQGAATVTVGQDALAAERKRAREITEMAAEHGMNDRAAEWIESGKSADAVGREILSAKAQGQTPLTPPAPKARVDMSEDEQKRYSIRRAIMAAAHNDWSEAGLEREVSQDLARQLRREPKGFYVPTNLAPPGQGRRAELTAGGAGAGAELVFTEPGSFIDMLRSRIVTAALGATFLPGLEGDVAFPRQTGSATATWQGENPGADVAESSQALDQLVLSPNELMARTHVSRKLLVQSTINAEQMIRRDLAAINARAIDKAGLHGAGGNEPTGVYNASGVNAVAMGGAITWAKIVELETAVVADDADVGVMAYATTPEVRGNAKTTEKAATTAQFLWTGSVTDGEMNGFHAMASNQIAKNLGVGTNEHGIIFAVWSELYIGEWGVMELIVDPYTLAAQGMIRIISHLMADVGLRHAQAFAKGTGLTVA